MIDFNRMELGIIKSALKHESESIRKNSKERASIRAVNLAEIDSVLAKVNNEIQSRFGR